MKKSLVVLLIAVLALSAVFAADVAITVEGDVSASYVFDFDDMTGTYNVPELNGALAWELVLPVAKAGSEYPYIDVAGEIEVDLADVAYYLTPAVDFSTFAIVGEDWKVDFLANIGTLDYAVSAIDTTGYAPKNAYGKQTGRYVPAALTYMWQSAAYYNDAVAVSKDGVGTLTFVGANTAEAIYNDKDGYATSEVVAVFNNLSEANDYCTEKNASNKNVFVSYKVGAKVSVTGLYPVYKLTTCAPATSVFAVEGESEELKLADSITTQFGFGFAKKTVSEIDKKENKALWNAVNAELKAAQEAKDDAKIASLKAKLDKMDEAANTPIDYMNAGFSTKTSYEDILTVAADFGYDFKAQERDGEKPFSFDVASSFNYEMVSVDVYYANGYLSYYNEKDLQKTTQWYQYYSNYDNVTRHSLLSAKAAVEVEEIGTTFTFTGKDLLEDFSLAYEAVNTYFDNYTFTFGVEAVEGTDHIAFDSVSFLAEADYTEEVGVTSYAGVTAYYSTEKEGFVFPVFEVGFAYDKNGFNFSVDFSSLREIINEDGTSGERAQYAKLIDDNKSFDYFALTVKAGYEAEMFTLSGAVEYNTHEKSAKSYRNWSLCQGLYVSAGIESDKLVDGATLSLDYASAELLTAKSADKTTQFGTLTAAVTVEF